MNTKLREFISVFLLLGSFSFEALASNTKANQQVQLDVYAETEGKRQLLFGVINDFFTPNSTDRHFTNGLYIGYITNELPGFLDWYNDEDSEEYYSVKVSQEMYTPEDIEDPNLIENDRPYSGWLYATVSFAKRRDNTLDVTMIDFGVVGPASQADKTQIIFHELIDTRDPRGWEHQLNNEVGVNFKKLRAHNKRIEAGNFVSDITGYYGGSLGNVKTSAMAGGMIRAGINIPDDMYVGFDLEERPFHAYLFAGVSGTYVARDIFLDGNTFEDSHSVDKINFVGRAKVGAAVKFGDFEVSYTYGITSRQFEEQDKYNRTGILLFSYEKKF